MWYDSLIYKHQGGANTYAKKYLYVNQYIN